MAGLNSDCEGGRSGINLDRELVRFFLVARRVDAVEGKLMNAVAGYREWSTIGLLGAAIHTVVGRGNRAVWVGGAERDGNGTSIPVVVSFRAAQSCSGHGWSCVEGELADKGIHPPDLAWNAPTVVGKSE